MRPILLNGHDRALTQVKYNREGDLLFSVAKDQVPNVWYADNGKSNFAQHMLSIINAQYCQQLVCDFYFGFFFILYVFKKMSRKTFYKYF